MDFALLFLDSDCDEGDDPVLYQFETSEVRKRAPAAQLLTESAAQTLNRTAAAFISILSSGPSVFLRVTDRKAETIEWSSEDGEWRAAVLPAADMVAVCVARAEEPYLPAVRGCLCASRPSRWPEWDLLCTSLVGGAGAGLAASRPASGPAGAAPLPMGCSRPHAAPQRRGRVPTRASCSAQPSSLAGAGRSPGLDGLHARGGAVASQLAASHRASAASHRGHRGALCRCCRRTLSSTSRDFRPPLPCSRRSSPRQTCSPAWTSRLRHLAAPSSPPPSASRTTWSLP